LIRKNWQQATKFRNKVADEITIGCSSQQANKYQLFVITFGYSNSPAEEQKTVMNE
jgi:hypothetical protein